MAPATDIENRFSYHPPTGDQAQRYEALRRNGRELAHQFGRLCPASREKSLAITKLQEAIMWANAAIACNEPEATEVPTPEAPDPNAKQVFLEMPHQLMDGECRGVHHPVNDARLTGELLENYAASYSVQDVETGGVDAPTIKLLVMTQAEVDALPEV